jgi:hypothetical protein
MPKCLNDNTKSYTGKEPSPKGLGYCSTAEEVGKIMKGKNDSFWIVKQIGKDDKKTNRWFDLKFNGFDDLSKDCYTQCLLPVTEKVKGKSKEKETGFEEKFGGEFPFFVKGESWPLCNDVPMVFIGQFKDPSKKGDTLILYRIFLASLNTSVMEKSEYHIDTIELNEENLKNQLLIKQPNVEHKIKSYDQLNYPLLKITTWRYHPELKALPYILKKYKITEKSFSANVLADMYYESIHCPKNGVKVGGTPMYTQYHKNWENETNFIQLSGGSETPYEWGDSGIAHISEDGTLTWDCA